MDVASGEFGTDLITLSGAAAKYATRRPTVHGKEIWIAKHGRDCVNPRMPTSSDANHFRFQNRPP